MTRVDLKLSEAQTRVVESTAPALVVVAPAGSGKTEVLARRIERILVESSDEGYRVLALSYTVKAADELKERLSTRLGDLHRRVDADTTHGFALSLLRSHGTRIGLPTEPEILTRDEDRVELLSDWLDGMGLQLPDNPVELFRSMDVARAQVTKSKYLDVWRDALASRGALDFPAMLERAVELTETGWVRSYLRRLYGHAALDEAQNLSRLQYQFLANVIGEPRDNIDATLVGDERQSIVGFAGADATLILEFERRYAAQRIELRTNFRSAQAIVHAGHRIETALGLQSPVTDREYPARGLVRYVEYRNEDDEADGVGSWVDGLLNDGLPEEAVAPGEPRGVRPEEIAVLARSGAALRLARDALETKQIPSALSSSEDEWLASTPARLAMGLVAFRNAPSHPSTVRSISRISEIGVESDSSPFAAIGTSPSADVRELAGLESAETPEAFISMLSQLDVADPDWPDDLALLEETFATFCDRFRQHDRSFGNFNQHLARCRRGDSLSDGVRLLTVHKAQGREFKAVAIVGCNNGQFPDFRAREPEEKVAELRVFYVAVTRAARLLLLTRAAARRTRYGSRASEPSPYLELALGR